MVNLTTKNNLKSNHKPTRNNRYSNFEILRIISMLFIIGQHYALHGGSAFLDSSPGLSMAKFLTIGGGFGVNCFILISAYFLVDSKFNSKKLLKLIFEVLFYLILFYIIFKVFNLGLGENVPDVKGSDQYWFVKSYIALYMVFPFLNMFIKILTKQRYITLIIILAILQGLFPTFTGKNPFTSSFSWFIYLYFIGGFIKKYPFKKITTVKIPLVSFIISYFIIFMPSLIYILTGNKFNFLTKIATNLATPYSLLLLFSSASLFITFKNLKVGCISIINLISSGTFGVYLIHDNSYFSPFLWHKIINCDSFYYSPLTLYSAHAILSILLIFIICCIIDLIRINGIEKFIFRIDIFDKYFNKINTCMNN